MKKNLGSQTYLRETVSQTHPCILNAEDVDEEVADIRRVTNHPVVDPVDVEAIILQNDLLSLSQAIYKAISSNDYSDLKKLLRKERELKRKYAKLVFSYHNGTEAQARVARLQAECSEWEEKRDARMYRARDAATEKMAIVVAEQLKDHQRVHVRQSAEIAKMEETMRNIGREFMSLDFPRPSLGAHAGSSLPVITQESLGATLTDLESDPIDLVHVDADWLQSWEILEKASAL